MSSRDSLVEGLRLPRSAPTPQPMKLQIIRLTTLCLVACRVICAGDLPDDSVVRANFAMITILDEAHVPAREAGVLLSLNVKAGAEVQATPPGHGVSSITKSLGMIDPAPAINAHALAEVKLQIATQKASNRNALLTAQRNAEFAEQHFSVAQALQDGVTSAIGKVEFLRISRDLGLAVLQVESEKTQLDTLRLVQRQAELELQAAKTRLARRQIETPIDGEVVEVFKRVGEWVELGQAVVHVVRMDRLRIEAEISRERIPPHILVGAAATAIVDIGSRQQVRFDGDIEYVDRRISADGHVRFWMLIDNKKDSRNKWLVTPGMPARVEITVPNGLAERVSYE